MKTLKVTKEVFISSLPLAAVIIIVCGFVAPIDDSSNYVKLLIGYVCVVFGQAVFLVGWFPMSTKSCSYESWESA